MPQARAGRASHTQDIGAPVDGHGHAAHMNNEAINHLATLGDRTAGAGAGARTEPLSVVAMTAQRQVNATTKKREVAVTA